MDFALKLQERTGKGYLSYSAIKFAADGSKQQDMKLFELYMKGLLKKDSDALSFGSLYDCLLLTPDVVHEKFFIIKDNEELLGELKGSYSSPKLSKAYKEWASSEKETALQRGLTIVSEEDWSQAVGMIKRLDASEVSTKDGLLPIRETFLKGNAQSEIKSWIGEIPIRGFLDILGDGFITDTKTTRSMSGFKYDVFSFCYDIQAYIYTETMGVNDFYWVVQEKSKPYLCGVFKATPQTLDSGKRKFWSGVENISRWLDNPQKDTETFAMFGTI